ncbi:sulfatase-like hydrolase/transferase, partial [Planctomycetaceae bacterium]|nr:sulfatase-like hydrolase/transferase [Planctomycetaceae bacterium]
MKHFWILFALLSLLPFPKSLVSADERPNIIVVLCDDLGYGDLRCYGNKELQTPHIDKFAAEGLKFTDCYSASPNCSPA